MARLKEEDSQRVKRQILAATKEEMALHGYAGLRVKAVAKRVGKTQGSIYARFRDKEALALACVEAVQVELAMPVMVEASAQSRTSLEALETIGKALAEAAIAHPTRQRMVARLAAELGSDDGPLAQAVRELFQLAYQALKTIVVEGQRKGEIRPEIDAEAFALILVALPISFSTTSVMFGEGTLYGEMDRTIRSIVTRGIRT